MAQITDSMLKSLTEKVQGLRAENTRLNQWVSDLQSGMYVNCVYCGHRYGPGETTPVSMADALRAHVEVCPKHPMSALKAEVERLRAENDMLKDTMIRACVWLDVHGRPGIPDVTRTLSEAVASTVKQGGPQ